MRHRVHNKKLGRSGSHREALIASLVSSLAKHGTIRTTLVKAKEARRVAEKLVTLARKGTLASRRLIAARLRDEEAAKLLCTEIAPKFEGRPGGYTRVVHAGCRRSDGTEMAFLAWVTEPLKGKDAEAEKPATEAAAEPAAAPAEEAK